MKLHLRTLSFVLAALAVSFFASCTILTSASDSISSALNSVSRSLGSVSGSLTSSSGGDSKSTREYRNDVELLTMLQVRSNNPSDSFKRDLSDVALRHGVSDWENNSATYVGVGRGLKRAGVDDSQLKDFLSRIPNPHANRLIVQGYNS